MTTTSPWESGWCRRKEEMATTAPGRKDSVAAVTKDADADAGRASIGLSCDAADAGQELM